MHPLFALPKAELHVHIEGTLEPELAFALARRNRLTLPFADVEALRAAYSFTSLQSFLDLYYACSSVLQTEQDFADLTLAYLRTAAAQGVRHTEMFFDPQAHTSRGVPVDVVMTGLAEGARIGRQELGSSTGLIACFLRHEPVAAAMATLESLEPYRELLTGVGLDSSEAGFPPGAFAEVFSVARELGLHTVAHAGEEGPPAYIWEALDELGIERIDHGVRILEDQVLVERVRTEQVPLTVCPLSNVRLRVVPELSAHMLPEMLAQGLRVTINSDDPAYFGGYVGDNFAGAAEHLGLTTAQSADLARTSFEAAFLDDRERSRFIAEIDAWSQAEMADSPRAAPSGGSEC